MEFLWEKIQTIGTAACPLYHLVIVIGGLSAEMTLKTVKLASTKYLDSLPLSVNEHGWTFHDVNLEAKVMNVCNTFYTTIIKLLDIQGVSRYGHWRTV